MEPWPYPELDARLATLRRRIQLLMGVPVAESDDDAAKAERDRIAAEAARKSQELFESLKKAVEEGKRK